MNAATDPAVLAPVNTLVLRMDEIMPSRTESQARRRARFSQKKLTELADSIRETKGPIHPIIVREVQGQERPFEIVCGEHRYIATQRAGFNEIIASVRDLNDQEALRFQLIENIQRQGLHEMEEAEAYRDLMDIPDAEGNKPTAEQVAESLGVSRSTFFARLKLLQLPDAAREAFYRGDLTSERALIVASIPHPKVQPRVLEAATQKDWRGGFAFSVRDLRQQFSAKGYLVMLKQAPFSQSDDTLAPRPCIGCEHRSGSWAAEGEDPDVCTDAPCYHAKVKAHGDREREQAVAAGAPVVSGAEAKKIAPKPGQLKGYVDLAEPCLADYFTEDDPEQQEGESDADFAKRENAFQARADAWQERTYGELLKDAGLAVTLLDDPSTGALRRLVSATEAAKVLQKQNIHLGSHSLDLPEPTPAEREARAAEQERLKDQQRRQEDARAKDIAHRRRVLFAIHEKAKGPLTHEELVMIAAVLTEDFQVTDALASIYTKVPQPGQMKDADLTRFIRLAIVAPYINPHTSPAPLFTVAKKHKIDVPALKKEPKGEAAKGKKS